MTTAGEYYALYAKADAASLSVSQELAALELAVALGGDTRGFEERLYHKPDSTVDLNRVLREDEQRYLGAARKMIFLMANTLSTDEGGENG